MTTDERTYLSLSKIIDTNEYTTSINASENSITFNNVTISTPPANFPSLEVTNFQVFINGVIIEPSAITSISQVGSDVKVDFGPGLEYSINDSMEIIVVGKFE